MLGEGPEVEWAAWPSFVPAEVDGLGSITYVLPLYLRGAVHHVEAGACGVPAERRRAAGKVNKKG